jgi:hypothetical protein
LKKQITAARQKIAELEKKVISPAISQKSDTSHQADAQKHFDRGYQAGVREVRHLYASKHAATQKQLAAIARETKQRSDTLGKEILRTQEHLGFTAQAHNDLVGLATRSAELLAGLADNTLEIPAKVPDNFKNPAPEASKPEARQPVRRAARETIETGDGSFKLDRLRRTILTALAQHPKGLTKAQIVLHSGYRASGDVSTAFAELSRHGLMEPAGGNLFRITDPGLAVLGDYDPLPVGSALFDWLLEGDKLSKVEKALLLEIKRAGPEGLPKGEIVQKSGYKPSGDISTAFARLGRYGYAVPSALGLRLATALTDDYETA